jgi:hypothetical protein
MPSGLFADNSSKGNAIIHAFYTSHFNYKLAFLVAGTNLFWKYPPGRHRFIRSVPGWARFGKRATDLQIYNHLPAPQSSHIKELTGHALMVAEVTENRCGSACIKACLRTGVGCLPVTFRAAGTTSCRVRSRGDAITDPGPITSPTWTSTKAVYCTGDRPGLGTHASTAEALQSLFTRLNTGGARRRRFEYYCG